ncbi:hypothetical protein ZHAS_00011604 [Anopheles sinensis]|uniref:Uncharacterized protein n=1 Tax=Anopheles sinensis TaxID=74873 RepID=A0A084W0X7_ANOSI|nr:hypothetical protein ZHAS_00011604 [Anopheles sinensis]
MEIISQLLSRRVAEPEVIQSYRKLLSYVSGTLHEANCSKIAAHFTSISKIALQSESISHEIFPVSLMKCILVLMCRLPVTRANERTIILEALRTTLQWGRHSAKLYNQFELGSLIRSAIAFTSHLQDDFAAITELIALARHILDTFCIPPSNEVHPVEVLLRSTYDKIFTRLVSEWTDIRCYETLLYVLFDLLKRDTCVHLKLEIVRKVADGAGGGMRRLVRLLAVPKHLRVEHLLCKLKTILTILLAHSLFRYEPTKRTSDFRVLLKAIKTIVDGVSFAELVKAKFLCLNLPRTELTFQSVCFVFIVRHLDLLDGVTSNASTELDYVYNLVASLNIVYHKRWKLPSFVLKHFVDGLSWIQLQPDEFRTKFIFHQQLDILKERFIVTGDDGLIHSLLTIFKPDTLIKILSTKQASPIARRNASVLLSKRSLAESALQRVMLHITRSQEQKSAHNTGTICDWVRAVHGSVPTLTDGSKRVLWNALSTIDQTVVRSDEQRLLLVDTKASLLVSMMFMMEDKVVELQIESARGGNRTSALKRKLSKQRTEETKKSFSLPL